ncbi:hypothetical protein EON79_03785 [bacterium]|nr:MAG: hypothetical protein EON79_03785 [bacterium]
MDFWDEELTPEQTETMLEKMAKEVKKRHLEVPVTMALELHKPLAGILGNGSIVFAPFLVPLLGFQSVNDYTRLLSKRENYERLMEMIERPQPQEEKCDPAS